MVCCASAYCTHPHYGGRGCMPKCINHCLHDGVSNNGNGIDHHALVFGPRGAVLPWNIVVVVVAEGHLAHANVLAVAAANGAPNGRGHIFLYVDCLNRLDPIDEGWLEEFLSKDGRLYAADESSALALKAKHLKHTLVEPTAEALELACHQLSLRKFEGSSKVSKALPQLSMDYLELMQKLVKDACKILVQMLERATPSRSSLPPLSSTHKILFCNTAELHASCLILAGLYPAPGSTADNWTNNPTCRNLKRFFTHFVFEDVYPYLLGQGELCKNLDARLLQEHLLANTEFGLNWLKRIELRARCHLETMQRPAVVFVCGQICHKVFNRLPLEKEKLPDILGVQIYLVTSLHESKFKYFAIIGTHPTAPVFPTATQSTVYNFTLQSLMARALLEGGSPANAVDCFKKENARRLERWTELRSLACTVELQGFTENMSIDELSGHEMGHLVSWILFSDVETYSRLVRLFQFAVSIKNDHPRLLCNSRFVARSVDPKSGSLDKIFSRVEDTGVLMPKKICSEEGCSNKTNGHNDVCYKSGCSSKKICSEVGCSNKTNGDSNVCYKSGCSSKKICSKEGCSNKTNGHNDVCYKSGCSSKKILICSKEGCTNKTWGGSNVCYKSGCSSEKTCSFAGCTKKSGHRAMCRTKSCKLKRSKTSCGSGVENAKPKRRKTKRDADDSCN